jgi:alkylation response protein AidB-like acyl-CoA dehydrogenase/enoyl-CoA hydratase/carnithine racemase
VGDSLLAGQGFAERLSGGGVGDRGIQGRMSHAGGSGPHARAEQVERAHGHAKALVDLAEQVVSRDVNTVDRPMLAEIAAAVADVAADTEARALVVSGAGKAFCAGADLTSLFGDPTRPTAEIRPDLKATYASFLGLADLLIPTIAAVDGVAVGAGVNIALACDIVIAGPRARFAITFADIGLHPGGGCSWFLTRRMGRDRALAAVLGAETIDADDAVRLGLATCALEDPVTSAFELAHEYALRDPALVKDMKRAVEMATTADLGTVLEFESWAQAAAVGRPVFSGIHGHLRGQTGRQERAELMAILWEAPLDEEAAHWVDVTAQLNRDHFVPLAAEIDRDQRYPWENVEKLVASGISGLMIPKELGGAGAALTTGVAVMAELSRGCASTGAIFAIHAMGVTPIATAGTQAQKEQYLGDIRAGKAVSFALTERGAGSDPSAISSTGTRTDAGWHLQGEKIYIGNGGASEHYVAFVRTDPDAGRRGISAFVTSLSDEGTVVERYADRMGLRGSRTSNLGLDTIVPPARLLGELGNGLRIALSTLNTGRIMIAAQAIGMATAAFEHASTEAVRRSTFGRPIIDNQAISFRLADIATRLSAARMMTWHAAQSGPDSEGTRALASMAKLFATEVAHDAVDTAVQIFGGDGYCKPNPVERFYRDQRVTEIYEGSSEIQRLTLGRAIADAARAQRFLPLEAPTTAYGHPVG